MPEEPGRFDGPDRFDPSSTSGGAGAEADPPFGGAPATETGTPQPGDPRLAAALGLLRVLCGALAASVLVYAGVAWFITSGATSGIGGGDYEPVGLPGAVVGLLAALAVFDLMIAPVIERALGAGGFGGGADDDTRQPSQDVDAAVATYRRAKLVGFAFREAAALLGLLIGLFTGNPSWCYALVAATLVAMALAWPSREGLVRAARGSVQPG